MAESSLIESIERVIPLLCQNQQYPQSSKSQRRKRAYDTLASPSPVSLALSPEEGLQHTAEADLCRLIQPVRRALDEVDAEMLLDLKRCPVVVTDQRSRGCGADGDVGDCSAVLRHDTRIIPIHRQIQPYLPCIRYLPIRERPSLYSIGLFVFPPNARMPLHDHPGMVVLSRVLYGSLIVTSFDILPDDPSHVDGSNHHHDGKEKEKKYTEECGWKQTFFSYFQASSHSTTTTNNNNNTAPSTTLSAIRCAPMTLTAPASTVLYPSTGNVHGFVAGRDGACVLDVLVPPYDDRECTFYEEEELDGKEGGSSCGSSGNEGERRLVAMEDVPDGFECVSGRYGRFQRED